MEFRYDNNKHNSKNTKDQDREKKARIKNQGFLYVKK